MFLSRDVEEKITKEKQEEISLQWDNMEKELHNDAMWYFLTNNTGQRYQTRIDLVLDLIAVKKTGNRETYHTFFELEKLRKDMNLDNLWRKISQTFLILKDWFENHELYHKIGYLIASDTMTLLDIYKLSEDKTKDDFRASLDGYIKDSIAIDNLLKNSEDEVADRIDRNRIPAILQETEHIILYGEIDSAIENHYNPNQTQEEIEKLIFLREHPEQEELLFRLEDSDMLHGQVSILGLDNLTLTDRFESLFNCTWDKIDCALMSIGDYGQMERNKWRYQYASSRRLSAWDELFHKSANSGFDKTSEMLIKLLNTCESFDDDRLAEMAENYIKACEREGVYPWRYYYIKYPEFRPGSFGKYGMATDNNAYQQYMFVVMQTKSQFSENTYDPFLFTADKEHIDRDDKGLSLRYDNSYIYSQNDAFIKKAIDSEEILESIIIKQDENGIDTENRIDKLKDYINKNYGA